MAQVCWISSHGLLGCYLLFCLFGLVWMLRFTRYEHSPCDLSAGWWGGNADHITVSHHLARNMLSLMLALILLISWLHAWPRLPVEHMGAIGAAIPPWFPLNWNLLDHKLQNQMHVSKAEADNLYITVKSHWFGESGVVLSAAWRLPWPGGEDPSQRSNAVQWMRCVGSAVGSRFSVNTGKILWLNKPLSQNIGVYYGKEIPYCGIQLYL